MLATPSIVVPYFQSLIIALRCGTLHKSEIENVQKFARRVVTRQWKSTYILLTSVSLKLATMHFTCAETSETESLLAITLFHPQSSSHILTPHLVSIIQSLFSL